MSKPTDIRAAIDEEALVWAIRVRDPRFGDWELLAAWLEHDPANLASYEAAVAFDDDLDAIMTVPPAAAKRSVAAGRRRMHWRAGAIAASILAVAGAAGWYAVEQRMPRDYRTAPGEHRSVTLADGSRVDLNGNALIVVDPARPREVMLRQGEALFAVRHVDGEPFVVRVAAARIEDIGTVFNVVAGRHSVDVAVAEGAVVYHGRRHGAIRLAAGDALSAVDGDAPPTLRRADAASVGSWRTGYLQYRDASFPTVAGDLSRNLGVSIEVDAALSARQFTGTIVMSGGADAVLARTGPLLGVEIVRNAKGWRMVPGGAARR